MKKVIALLAVCGFALAFTACGKKADEAAAADSTVVETPVATPDTAKVDSAAAHADSVAH